LTNSATADDLEDLSPGCTEAQGPDIFFPAVLTLRITAAAPETVTCFTNSATSTTCDAEPEQSPPNVDTFAFQRVCYCEAGGGVAGDPHIHSLRGAHYTLLQQGVFVAWNFSKAVPASTVPSAAPPRGWQLLAAYAGHRFTTQGLLLLDPHSGQSMEITAEDCSWRVKEQKTPWRKAQVELLSAEDGTTSLQVKRLHEKLGETKILRSAILLQMGSGSDMKNISTLVVHCRPKHHLDFKISMFQKSDIDHVGDELGVAPDVDHNYHFLFSKQGMMRMRADQEFKAPGSWVTLGGSPAGAAYLEKKHQTGTSMVQSQGCSDAQEDDARAICSKHLQQTTHPETFADCVYDLCHGGDESFAQSAAAFLSESSA